MSLVLRLRVAEVIEGVVMPDWEGVGALAGVEELGGAAPDAVGGLVCFCELSAEGGRFWGECAEGPGCDTDGDEDML